MADNNTQIIGTNVNKQTDFNLSQTALPDLKDKTDAEITTAMWGIQPSLIKEISNMNKVYSSKHGMFSNIKKSIRHKITIERNFIFGPHHLYFKIN